MSTDSNDNPNESEISKSSDNSEKYDENNSSSDELEGTSDDEYIKNVEAEDKLKFNKLLLNLKEKTKQN